MKSIDGISSNISWLSFNDRVLHESLRTRHPLLERLRFLSISGSNLDEFYRVRAEGFRNNLLDSIQKKLSKKHQTTYTEIIATTQQLMDKQDKTLRHLRDVLEPHGLHIAFSPKHLNYYRLKPVGWITLAKRIKRFKALHRKISNVTDPS